MNFIKSISIKNQKIKLLAYYILNLLDLLFTQFTLFDSPHLFKEVNPFLASIILSNQVVYLKIIIPLILVIYWFVRYTKASDLHKKRANIAMNIVLLAYFIINLIHVFNLSIILYLG